MNLKTKTYFVVLCIFFSVSALAAPKIVKPAPVKAEKKDSATVVLNDAWYTMQTGSTAWGYYHERIEQKDSKFYYRYEMTKRESGQVFNEALGAIAQLDLTPIAFNLSKAGSGAVEIVNGTFVQEKNGPVMNLDIKGARQSSVKRHMPKETILEAFFPVYLKLNWSKIKAKPRGRVFVFTEDASSQEYVAREVSYEMKAQNAKDSCTEFAIELNSLRSVWCVNESAAIAWMDINNHQAQVKKVKDEAEAKRFLNVKSE